MKEITAPYGFVPLAEKVVEPEWVQPILDDQGHPVAAPPLHDVPFQDGIDGVLELEVTAETPIFTRGTEASGPGEGTSTFFSLPDGRKPLPALPGTLLRGAIRNVVEIATFGRMAHRVNDHRYSVRDLDNPRLYGEFMAGIVRDPQTRKSSLMPLVNAGWLQRGGSETDGDDGEGYQIEVCDFAKIEYTLLSKVAQTRDVDGFRPEKKQSAVRKYETWGTASRDVQVNVRFVRPDTVDGRRLPSQYGTVESIGQNGRQGTLVFTGQPVRYVPPPPGERRRGHPKHHDFVFLPSKNPQVLAVPSRVFRDFEFVHSARGQQNNLGRSEQPNEEWGYWKPRLERGERVPVFFLASKDGQHLVAFGLAMMFRLPYRCSIREAVGHVQKQGTSGWEFDFADGLFGAVREFVSDKGRKTVLALKSRVDFSHAVLSGGAAAPLSNVTVVLGAPKASYYPNYVEQVNQVPGCNPPRDGKGKPLYKTWQDDDCRPRGWKRYRPLTETWQPQLPRGADGKPLDVSRVASRFQPLPAGARFVGRVYLHNVRPVELGALLWAVDFGGEKDARHTLGMGRPLGYGRCRLRLSKFENLRNHSGGQVDPGACRQAFQEFMTREIADWVGTPQILELIALARPVAPAKARYQRLDAAQGINEFKDAKRDGLALPSAHLGSRDAPVSGGGGAADGGPSFRREGPQRGQPARTGTARKPNVSRSPVVQPTPGREGSTRWKRGHVLRVRLVGLSKKGKWRGQVVGQQGIGVIEGEAPAGAALDLEFDVEVINGGDPNNLNLRWRSGS